MLHDERDEREGERELRNLKKNTKLLPSVSFDVIPHKNPNHSDMVIKKKKINK